jgi:hypothetical protein
MKYLSLALVLLLSSLALAQREAPDLGIPAELKPTGQYVTLKPKTDAKAITYIGMSGVDPLPAEFLADPRWFLLDTRGLAIGRYVFTAVGSLDDVHTRAQFVVVVGDAPPTPEPGPGPTPVPPNPDEKPFPTVGEGLRVMIVWEDEDRAKLPTSTLYAIQGVELTNYLNTHCAKDETGRPDWMIQDDDFTDAQINVMPERWRKPYKDAVTYAHHAGYNPPLPNGAMNPVIIVSNSLSKVKPPGILTKLPAGPAILPLIKKYE